MLVFGTQKQVREDDGFSNPREGLYMPWLKVISAGKLKGGCLETDSYMSSLRSRWLTVVGHELKVGIKLREALSCSSGPDHSGMTVAKMIGLLGLYHRN